MPTDPNQVLAEIQQKVELMTSTQDVASYKEYLSSFSIPDRIRGEGPQNIEESMVKIIENVSANKYIFSIVITACLKKIIDPQQDIRVAQENMPNGYSNRSLDSRVVTPFLKRHNYTHCQASGLESGRNLERPIIWDLDFQCNPRGANNREAFLSLLDFVQLRAGSAKKVIEYFLYLDAAKRQSDEIVQAAPHEQEITKIITVITRHITESSGQGRSRLPVLALYSVYEVLVLEVARYNGSTLLPLERHTAADLRSGSIGDIQINKNREPFEGIEIKSDRSITADMVTELRRKFNGRAVDRYYILTTASPAYRQEDAASISAAVLEAESSTGCQIIVNSLLGTFKHYLRLVSDPGQILEKYSLLLASDPDIRPELVAKWNAILAEEYAA